MRVEDFKKVDNYRVTYNIFIDKVSRNVIIDRKGSYYSLSNKDVKGEYLNEELVSRRVHINFKRSGGSNTNLFEGIVINNKSNYMLTPNSPIDRFINQVILDNR